MIEWGIEGIYLFEGNHAMIYGSGCWKGECRVPHVCDLELEFRQIGLDEVRHADLTDVVGVEGHVKQLLPPPYVDLAEPYSAPPGVHHQFDVPVHDHVNDAYQQVRNAISARGPGQCGIDHYRDRELVNPRLNPHVLVLVRYHHALVHIHLVLHGVVGENNEMVSKRVEWRGVVKIDGEQNRFLGVYVLLISVGSYWVAVGCGRPGVVYEDVVEGGVLADGVVADGVVADVD
jgi:hypothetical protein